MDDRVIIQLFRQRDEAAISAVREKYGAYCRAVALGITGDEQDAEECVSEALYRLWDSIPPAEPESLRAFAGRIVRNISINLLRGASRQSEAAAKPYLLYASWPPAPTVPPRPSAGPRTPR